MANTTKCCDKLLCTAPMHRTTAGSGAVWVLYEGVAAVLQTPMHVYPVPNFVFWVLTCHDLSPSSAKWLSPYDVWNQQRMLIISMCVQSVNDMKQTVHSALSTQIMDSQQCCLQRCIDGCFHLSCLTSIHFVWIYRYWHQHREWKWWLKRLCLHKQLPSSLPLWWHYPRYWQLFEKSICTR